MKSRFAKITAAAMAVTMCLPMAASAAQEGSFETSFDVYSPVLTISVPTTLDVRVNPIADSSKNVGRFTVASNSIDILNASVDLEKDQAIPVNVTVKARVDSAAEDVVTEYNTFTADAASMKKKIYLELTEANKAATIGLGKDDQGTALTAAFDTDGKLDLAKYAVANPAEYDAVTNKAAITKYGSLLSMNIAGPTTANTTDIGETFSKNASDVTAAVGSFAVTGEANTNADWKTTDVRVAVTYNVKASKPVTVTTPAIATAPTLPATNNADVTITVPSIGEATVMAVGVHNDESYGDYVWDTEAYKVDYTTTAGSAVITIPKDDAGLKTFAEFKGTHDLVIGLSDGRMVVSTFTVQ